MNRPNFKLMTDREQRQNKACLNEYLGRQYAAQQRRKRIQEARMKAELNCEREDYEFSNSRRK